MSEPFIGEIRIFGGNFAPRGWANCDGTLLPIAENTALFAILGTTYGGDGRTTMALPDFRDRVAMHPGRAPGLSTRTLGQRGGSATVTLTEAQMPNHTHPLRGSTNLASEHLPTNHALAEAANFEVFSDSTENRIDLPEETLPATAGGNQPHNNMQPYLGLRYIIALRGLFPSRG